LRGRVLPIGGLKEKLLAALRGGIKTVIIPEENRKDLADIPKNVTQGLEIVPVKWIDQVLDIALVRPIVLQASDTPVPVEAVEEPVEHKHEALRPH
jgi:ATP-dependent Lon protease